jgi:hypothetical protein
LAKKKEVAISSEPVYKAPPKKANVAISSEPVYKNPPVKKVEKPKKPVK